MLKKFCETVSSRGGSRSRAREFLESGNAAAIIVGVAKKWRADLIAIGSHGHGKVKGILMGSVSQDVLRDAPCPILIVPPKSKV